MKRPEGFDRDPIAKPKRPPRRPERPAPPPAPAPTARRGVAATREGTKKPLETAPSARGSTPRARTPKVAPKSPKPPRPPRDTSVRDARREARRAAAERRRYERLEVARFTRRRRARVLAALIGVGLVGAVGLLVVVAVFSPLLALRTITVDGAERVDAGEIESKLSAQIGTPLALVNYGKFDDVLSQYSVIRSFTTETIPPSTIAVHIVEREPIATVKTIDGTYRYVDAAGVSIEDDATRRAGVPLIVDSTGEAQDQAFTSAVQVLLAMAPSMRAEIDTVSAKTIDDVTLTFVGQKQSVKWGSPADSQAKADLLAALRKLEGDRAGTFDVSAVTNGVFRPASVTPTPPTPGEPTPTPTPTGIPKP